MNFQFSFKHMDSSPALQEYAEAKIREKIQKFVTKAIEAQVTFSVDRHDHRAHCRLVAGDGFDVDVEHTCGDMYGSVDLMVDKLAAQLKKQKEKLKDHKHQRLNKMALVEDDSERKQSNGKSVIQTSSAEIVDAGDIVKYEESRKRAAAGRR